MTLTIAQSLIIVGVVALGTIITRFLPFIIFPANKQTPKFIIYLSTVLPYSVIGLLVVYCLKNVSFANTPFGLPEGISILYIVLLHNWKRNMLLSIGTGTVLYMVLVQFVFI